MDKISVAEARREGSIGKRVVLQGWVRTRRDSKGGFSFIELNDGSSQGNVQVVAPGELPNYESVVKHLHTGASVVIEGEVKASPAKGQPTEVQATRVEQLGDADAESYPLQKKGHTFEFLRTIAHLRPRTNTFGVIDRMRHRD
jgi:asparaginyl-tRNA synthetase